MAFPYCTWLGVVEGGVLVFDGGMRPGWVGNIMLHYDILRDADSVFVLRCVAMSSKQVSVTMCAGSNPAAEQCHFIMTDLRAVVVASFSLRQRAWICI